MLVHTLVIIRQQTIMILIAFHIYIISNNGHKMNLRSIYRAHKYLTQEVFFGYKQDFSLQPNEILKLLKPENSMADSGYNFFITLKAHLEGGLKMTQ